MKPVNHLSKPMYILWLSLLLVALVVTPTIAQEPEQGEDVEAQVSFHGGFDLNPFSDLLGVTNGGVPVPQLVPSGSRATTEFMVTDVEDLYSVNLAFDFDGEVVESVTVRPGSLFDDYTKGVDYIFRADDCYAATPLDPATEYTLPIGPDEPGGPANPRRCYVSIAVIDPTLPPVRGNGSLIKVDWKIRNTAPAGALSEIDFTLASLLDEFGNRLEPCIGAGPACANIRVDPSVFNNPGNDDPFLPPTAFIIGLLQVGGAAAGGGLDFQVALEGGKSPTAPPAVTVAVKDLGATSNFNPDAAGAVDTSGAGTLPYDSLTITRPGYLRFESTNVSGIDPSLLTLLAGDVNDDDHINILDIMLVAQNFNLPVNANNEKMNFNSDNRITIADLALVAKNFDTVGPSQPGTTPGRP